MTDGFSIVELLVTLTIVLLIAGALLAAVRPARQAFDRVPAELDLQQRGRTALDAIAQPLRSALIADVSDDGTTLTAITVVPQSGQGVLSAAQVDPAAPLALSTFYCPNIKDVCGFSAGVTAMVLDGQGVFDVFTIAAVSAANRTLAANRVLSRAYGKGTIVSAVDYSKFSLAVQSDGSFSLVRETYAGAVQPIVDFVSDLTFARGAGGVDVSIRVHPADGKSSIPPHDFKSLIALRYPW